MYILEPDTQSDIHSKNNWKALKLKSGLLSDLGYTRGKLE